MDLRPLVDILNQFSKIYKKNSQKTERDYELCKMYAEISRYIVIGIPICVYALGSLYVLAAYYEGFMSGNVTPPAHIYFPIIDQLGRCGVILTHVLNTVNMYGGGTFLIPFEILTYIVFANFTLSSMVIRKDLDDLKVALENPTTVHREIRWRLLEIIKSHRKYNE